MIDTDLSGKCSSSTFISCLSGDGSEVAIGVPCNDENKGRVGVFENVNESWRLRGD